MYLGAESEAKFLYSVGIGPNYRFQLAELIDADLRRMAELSAHLALERALRLPHGPQMVPAPAYRGRQDVRGTGAEMPADLSVHRDQRACALRRDGRI